MKRNRRQSAVLATLFCWCALVVAAGSLEQSLSAETYRPAEQFAHPQSGGLLYLLLALLFGLLGIEPPDTVGATGASGLGRLVRFLASNVAELLALAALLVLAGGVWLTVRRVDVAERLEHRFANAPAGTPPRERSESLRTVEPANEVYRAWLVVVRRVARDPSRSRTPSEWANRAVDAGLDEDAVGAVTDAFREVRYGDVPVTEDRERRVRDALARLDVGRRDDG